MLSIVEINTAPEKDQTRKYERGIRRGRIGFFRFGGGGYVGMLHNGGKLETEG